MRLLIALCFLLCAAPVFAQSTESVLVVSDINNTIRASGPVAGMPEAYQRLAEAGAKFHYVSFSTKSEQGEIEAFIKEAGFPAGELHLREKGGSPSESKPPVIRKLLADNKEAQFILIADSGWEDPEIYGDIARENKSRIRHIYIRNVTGEERGNDRFKKAFDGLDAAQWTLFDDPSEIVLK